MDKFYTKQRWGNHEDFAVKLVHMNPTLLTFRQQIAHRLEESVNSLAWLKNGEYEATVYNEFLDPARTLLAGGKRTRAGFVLAGYQLACARSTEPAVLAGSAMELYQASALVHDDVIDDSPQRRGNPAAHVAFASQHRANSWLGSPTKFGTSSAILLGDLLLAHAAQEFTSATALVDAGPGARALSQFNSMCVEVAFGQYLDIRAEHQPLDQGSDAIESALSVLRHKSASYSVQLPLVIGCMLGGASEELIAQARGLGGKLGEAFQMRDDDLGVFGEPEQTGKPACGDITEGKRTVLLALTRRHCPEQREWIDSLLGRELTGEEVAKLRSLIVSSGARDRHEEMIQARESQARQTARDLDGREEGAHTLTALMDELAGRNS